MGSLGERQAGHGRIRAVGVLGAPSQTARVHRREGGRGLLL